MAYWTGMRKGEIWDLTWGKLDMKARMIRLEAEDTRDRYNTVDEKDKLLAIQKLEVFRAIVDQTVDQEGIEKR
jgi:integrase